MRKIQIFIALFIVFIHAIGHGREISRVVAILDDQAITSNQVREKISLYRLFLQGNDISEKDLYNLALQNTIDDAIISNYSGSYSIPDTIVMDFINKLLLDNGMKITDLEAFLSDKGLSMASLKNHFTKQIIWNNLLVKREDIEELLQEDFQKSKSIKRKIAELTKAAEQPLMERLFKPTSKVLLSEIVITSKNQKAIQLLMETGDLVKVKKTFPDSVQLQGDNGSLGWINFNDLSDLYKEAITQTGLREISRPIFGQDFIIFLKPLAFDGVTIKKELQNPYYFKLSYDQKANLEFAKRFGENYSSYQLKNLREAHYVQIFD
jgi:hypothetical protein